MNCLLVMKIKWSLDINTGAVERSEAVRARRLAGATVVGDDVIASTGYMKKQPISHTRLLLSTPTHSTDSCGEWVECMGVVSKRQVWLVGVGGIYGCS